MSFRISIYGMEYSPLPTTEYPERDIWLNAFLQDKANTQTVNGGNTDLFYRSEGTLPKSKMLAAMHPDVVKVVWKFSRWHHVVDFRPFRNNRLVRDDTVAISEGVNNYGMTLRHV